MLNACEGKASVWWQRGKRGRQHMSFPGLFNGNRAAVCAPSFLKVHCDPLPAPSYFTGEGAEPWRRGIRTPGSPPRGTPYLLSGSGRATDDSGRLCANYKNRVHHNKAVGDKVPGEALKKFVKERWPVAVTMGCPERHWQSHSFFLIHFFLKRP